MSVSAEILNKDHKNEELAAMFIYDKNMIVFFF